MEETLNELLEIATTYEELEVLVAMMYYDYNGYWFYMKRSGLAIREISPADWDDTRVNYILDDGGKRSSQVANLSRNVEIVE